MHRLAILILALCLSYPGLAIAQSERHRKDEERSPNWSYLEMALSSMTSIRMVSTSNRMATGLNRHWNWAGNQFEVNTLRVGFRSDWTDRLE